MLNAWAFGTSPHGLGLSADEWWFLTPREAESLCEVWQTGHDHTARIAAHLRADVHNAWMPRTDQQAWSANDFLPEHLRRESAQQGPFSHRTAEEALAWGRSFSEPIGGRSQEWLDLWRPEKKAN